MPADGHKAAQQQAGAQPGQEQGETSAAGPATGTATGPSTSTQTQAPSTAAPGQGKKKGKEVMITPDQVSCWSTKKTPVRKVMFTRMNLVVAGGCYEPDR
jgi:transcription initiation factor TFIID subunit 5